MKSSGDTGTGYRELLSLINLANEGFATVQFGFAAPGTGVKKLDGMLLFEKEDGTVRLSSTWFLGESREVERVIIDNPDKTYLSSLISHYVNYMTKKFTIQWLSKTQYGKLIENTAGYEPENN